MFFSSHHPECIECNQPINGHYYKDIWGNAICSKHYRGYCHCCGRLLSKRDVTSENQRIDPDSRYCSSCLSTSVVSMSAKTPDLLREHLNYILKKLAEIGINLDPHNISIRLAPAKVLKERVSRTSRPIGLAQTVYRNGKMYHTILLQDGMPKIIFIEVLSHELGHVWINENDLDKRLTQQEDEGFCELIAYHMMKLSASKVGDNIADNLIKNSDPIYGEGLRIMKARKDKLGWEKMIINMHRYPVKR